MRFEQKITLTLCSMAFSDGSQNYWQSEPFYSPHSENMTCANSEREKRDISCRTWENEKNWIQFLLLKICPILIGPT